MSARDTKRLNWFSKQGRRTIKNVSPQSGNSRCLGWSYNGRDFILHAKEGQSLRQAMDACMKSK